MKVLMFGWEFPPLSSGGLGTACYGIAKSLSKKGVELIFVLPYLSDQLNADFARFISPLKIKLRKVKSPLGPYMDSENYHMVKGRLNSGTIYGTTLFDEVYRYTLEAEKIAEEEDFDVVHCHDWMTFGAGIVAANKKNKPLIVHIHATEFDRTGGNGVNQHVYELERRGMHSANRVVAVSNYTKNKIVQHYGVSPDKIAIVHNGVEHELNGYVENFEIKNGNRIVLFLGRITLQKGPDYFIYAAKKVLDHEKNVLFVVAGAGDMHNFIIEKAAELGIADKVLFTGFLNQNDATRIYRMADVFVMPSVSEPFGITPLEAIKNKTPAIISNNSGVSEVLSNCLKVDFWNIDEMSNKIISLLRYKPLHDCLIENSYEEIRRINWDTAAEKCINIYNEVNSAAG